jgi:hypothetical protein
MIKGYFFVLSLKSYPFGTYSYVFGQEEFDVTSALYVLEPPEAGIVLGLSSII